MEVKTPAKINPLLYILNKREDGYHEMYMHMVPVNLFDSMTFSHNNDQGLHFLMNGATFSESPEDNLVVRAVRIFEQESEETVNLNVILKKNIPSGAGLGGGSGNAAGTLMVLNHLYRRSSETEGLLSPEKMHKVALELGSDVPFFLEPSPSEIRGRGEKIKPLLGFPKLFLIIIKPPLTISTKEAYKKCNPKTQTNFPNASSIHDLKSYFQNQFETSLLVQFPILSELKTFLLENGAFGALVSGSGSAVFGAYYNKITQNKALKKLSCLPVGEIFSCETMLTHSYY